MAGQTTGRRRAAAEPEPTQDGRADTKRVVLKRERVIVLPDTVPENGKIDLAKLAEALGMSQAEAKRLATTAASGFGSGTAWVVVGEFAGASKNAAIEAHAGKPGTPDAKPGAYKAPSVSAFAGGLLYERPPEPKVERKALD